MALSREQKEKKIEKLRQAIAKQKAMVFVNFSGLKAQDVENLRNKLNQIGAKFMVTKKTLAKLAFSKEKIAFPEQEFKNELGIVFALEDEMAPSKAAFNFSKENESLQIVGGYIESEFMPAQEMIALAQLPSRKELLGQLVGTLSTPISNFINVQKANIKGLIYALEAIKKNY